MLEDQSYDAVGRQRSLMSTIEGTAWAPTRHAEWAGATWDYGKRVGCESRRLDQRGPLLV